jgi:membrane associated rhomboid family serine protease
MSRRLAFRNPFGSIRMPRVVAALIAATAVVSIAAAIGARNGAPGLVSAGLLVVPAVWQGELWRLLTWVFYELDVLPLVFACLTLFWFGSDLARAWGPRRFLGAFFGIAAGAGVVTCLVGRFLWPEVALIPQSGSWPVLDALMVAWGLIHSQRELRLYGVVRLTGRQLVWITLLGTVLYGLFRGLALYVPHLAAELLVLAWLGPVQRMLASRRQRRNAGQAWSFDTWLAGNRRR